MNTAGLDSAVRVAPTIHALTGRWPNSVPAGAGEQCANAFRGRSFSAAKIPLPVKCCQTEEV